MGGWGRERTTEDPRASGVIAAGVRLANAVERWEKNPTSNNRESVIEARKAFDRRLQAAS